MALIPSKIEKSVAATTRRVQITLFKPDGSTPPPLPQPQNVIKAYVKLIDPQNYSVNAWGLANLLEDEASSNYAIIGEEEYDIGASGSITITLADNDSMRGLVRYALYTQMPDASGKLKPFSCVFRVPKKVPGSTDPLQSPTLNDPLPLASLIETFPGSAAFLSALSFVSHDNTLIGSGTAASPLGVADGGLLPIKFSTTNNPTDGNVLTYNAALKNLTWETPGEVSIADDSIEAIKFESTNTPTDGQVALYDSASGGFRWANQSGGGGSNISLSAGDGIDLSLSNNTYTISAEDATNINKGIIEIATTAEVVAGVDRLKAVTPETAASVYTPIPSGISTGQIIKKDQNGWTASNALSDAGVSKVNALFRASAWYIDGASVNGFGLMRFNDSAGNQIESAGSWDRLVQLKLYDKGATKDPSAIDTASTDALDDVFANLEVGGSILLVTSTGGNNITVALRVTNISLASNVYTLGVSDVAASAPMASSAGLSWMAYISPFSIPVEPSAILGLSLAGNYKAVGTNGTGNVGFIDIPQKASVPEDIAGINNTKYMTPLGFEEAFGSRLDEGVKHYSSWVDKDYSKSGSGSGVTGGAISSIPGNPFPIDDTNTPTAPNAKTKFHTNAWVGTKPTAPSGNVFGAAIEVWSDTSGTSTRYLIVYWTASGGGTGFGRKMYMWKWCD